MAVATETIGLETGAETKLARFDVHQVVQHAGLAVSFILLVVTGLPLKYADLAVSRWWAGVMGGADALRAVHHFSAYVMVIVCAYHAIYILYGMVVLKRPFPVAMIPSLQDFTAFLREFAYFIGLSRERPQFDRFNWREKFDYWAIFWGVPVMAGSGFILMYPVLVTRYLPGWVVPAALVAHSDEAMLALGWIFMVHVFFNHFTPGIFPVNTSMFTGKVSHERYRTDHPLEYQRMVSHSQTAPPIGEAVAEPAKEAGGEGVGPAGPGSEEQSEATS